MDELIKNWELLKEQESDLSSQLSLLRESIGLKAQEVYDANQAIVEASCPFKYSEKVRVTMLYYDYSNYYSSGGDPIKKLHPPQDAFIHDIKYAPSINNYQESIYDYGTRRIPNTPFTCQLREVKKDGTLSSRELKGYIHSIEKIIPAVFASPTS